MDNDMFEKLDHINVEDEKGNHQDISDQGVQKTIVDEVLPTISESPSKEQPVPPSKKTIQFVLKERLAWFIAGFFIGALIGLSSSMASYQPDVPKTIIISGLVVGGLSLIFGENFLKWLASLGPL